VILKFCMCHGFFIVGRYFEVADFKQSSAVGDLNPHFGAFRIGEEVWQGVMLLTPVTAGRKESRRF